jgi:hypothetical protein
MVPTIVAVTSWLHAEEARTVRIANTELHRKSALLLISTTSNFEYLLVYLQFTHSSPEKEWGTILSTSQNQLAKNMSESTDIDQFWYRTGNENQQWPQHRANFIKKQQFFMMVLY